MARAELTAHFPGLSVEIERRGGLDLISVDLTPDDLPSLARLSFVQGVLAEEDGKLTPLEVDAGLSLPDELVTGAKYQGKTHELVTQLALNLGLRFTTRDASREPLSVLDPMAGRGTTLLWALRYALNARGIEQDRGALEAFHRHVKKQTKLHRISHRQRDGFIGTRNKQGRGEFVQFDIEERTVQLISGDSAQAPDLLGRQRFDILVADLPYGIQHTGSNGLRNPLPIAEGCADAWVASMRQGGVAVLIFNSYQPKRDDLIEAFTRRGCELVDFSAPHRMSESIVRDLVVLRNP